MAAQEYNVSIVGPLMFFLNEKARYKVAYGGRGSGKSMSAALSILTIALRRKVSIACAREYQTSIRDSVHKLLVHLIDKCQWNALFEITHHHIKAIKTGSTIIFKGLHNNVSSQQKSLEVMDIIWIEEAESITQATWDALTPTIRNKGSEIWVTFNPRFAKDPMYRIFITNTPPDAIVKKVNYCDNFYFYEDGNPLPAEMEYCKRTDYEKYRHIWLGEPVTHSDRLIFNKKFEVLTFDEPNKDDITSGRFFFGADWGAAHDPNVLIRCYISGDCLYIDHEAYGLNMDIEDIAELFAKVPGAQSNIIHADSARPETIGYVRRRGFPQIRRVIKSTKQPGATSLGYVQDGIAYLRSFRKIYIHERCKYTIDEFSTYSYKVDRITGEVLSIPEDKNNHCIDALRYALSVYMRAGSKATFLDVYQNKQSKGLQNKNSLL
jgi:phage terminase large subunit